MEGRVQKMAVGGLSAGRHTVEENLAPAPSGVDSERHPEVAGSSEHQAGGQTVERCGDRAEAVSSGIEVVRSTHQERTHQGGRPETDAGRESEQQIPTVEEVFEQGSEKKRHGPGRGVFHDIRAMQRQRPERES